MSKSVMSNHFNRLSGPSVQRSSFDRSHSLRTSFYAGSLVPIYVDEALPGDTFNCKLNMFIRKSSSIVPSMDNIYVDVHFFFVPMRLVWTNFKKFMGEQVNPADSTSYAIPTMTVGTAQGAMSLYDYFGLPTELASAVSFAVNTLPFRAYNLIFNDWYRDENLQNSVTVNLADSGDLVGNFAIKYRNKGRDYFTSCLPWPQKNNTGTPVDFLVGAPVDRQSNATSWFAYNTGTDTLATPNPVTLSGTSAINTVAIAGMSLDPSGGLKLGASTIGTINALRQAFQIQKLYERDARGGTRYTEIIRSHFGVTSPDARLQRSEFLGGLTARINEHPVPQTTATGLTGGSTPQANLSAFGTAANSGGFVQSFTEHGYVIGIASTRVDLSYQDGIDKLWSRSSRLDFYWPALANLGEQAVLNKEIQWLNDGNDSSVWGYQERYSEYRYKTSRITGSFKSRTATPLDVWHYAQDYKSGRISLNETFMAQPSTPIARNVAVVTQPYFFGDFYFRLICARPMPTYSIPGLVDHF